MLSDVEVTSALALRELRDMLGALRQRPAELTVRPVPARRPKPTRAVVTIARRWEATARASVKIADLPAPVCARAPQPAPGIRRSCLNCDRPFLSSGNGNRLCAGCR